MSFSSHSLQSLCIFSIFTDGYSEWSNPTTDPTARVQGPGGSPGGEMFLGVDGSFANKLVHDTDKNRFHAHLKGLGKCHGCKKGHMIIMRYLPLIILELTFIVFSLFLSNISVSFFCSVL